jgi:hypothetical protein
MSKTKFSSVTLGFQPLGWFVCVYMCVVQGLCTPKQRLSCVCVCVWHKLLSLTVCVLDCVLAAMMFTSLLLMLAKHIYMVAITCHSTSTAPVNIVIITILV